jgi:hypothetical protein
MLSSGANVVIWDEMLSSGANVIIWDKMLSSGMKRYHLELMLSSGTTYYYLGLHVIIWDAMLSSGANVIIWDKKLSSRAKVIMVSSGANVIIWCYHVMLSSGMITHPCFIFPENFTHSTKTSIDRRHDDARDKLNDTAVPDSEADVENLSLILCPMGAWRAL